MNKTLGLILLLITACLNKQKETDQSKNESSTKVEFDFSFDQVKTFHVDSFSNKNNWLQIYSSNRAYEVNFLADIYILNRLLYRNLDQIKQMDFDSLKLVVKYIGDTGKDWVEGYSVTDKTFILNFTSELDEHKDNYYNRVADLMYSDTLFYAYSNELSLHLYYQFHGNKNMWTEYKYFDCFAFFMKINLELLQDVPNKYNYEKWKDMEEGLLKYEPDNPILTRVKEISQIFSMDLRKGKGI